MNSTCAPAAAALCALAFALPVTAASEPVGVEATRDEWQFATLVYGYYAGIGSSVTFPNGQTSSVTVNASDIIDNLKFGAMGTFEARKGSWGLLTDVMYLNVGNAKSGFRDLTIGNAGLPADVSAHVNFDMKSTVWTLAGTYRIVASPEGTMDVLAGARLLSLQESLSWTLNGNVGPIPLPGRAGYNSDKENYIDAVVGLKGRVGLGTERKWFIPYYADIGTGNSDLTWQAMGGLGYAFRWGEVIGGWRYMDYQFKSDSKIDSMYTSGPLLGVAFHW